MALDAGSIALLAIAGSMIISFGGMVVTIHSSANSTNRRIDDFRAEIKSEINLRFTEVDRRFTDSDRRFMDSDKKIDDLNRKIDDLKIEIRDVRGRIDYIADSLSLGRAKAKRRA